MAEMSTGLSVATDVPPKADGCRHNYALREAILDAVNTMWTTTPSTAERTITRLQALKERIAAAAGVNVSQVTNKIAARAMYSYLEERFGGTD